MAEKILALSGSPRANGNSDWLVECFARGAEEMGSRVERICLRDLSIKPCVGCNTCFVRADHSCILRRQDDTEELFARMEQSGLVLIAAPIYFYALPAVLKGFIDRSQRFWAALEDGAETPHPPKPVWSALLAARQKGDKLFSGSELCLKYFAKGLGRELTETIQCKGYSGPDDLRRDSARCARLVEWGRRAAAL